MLSFCRVEDRFADRLHRREFFLIDQLDANPGLAHVLRDALDEIAAFRDAGIPVVVHCHAGESRTAFVLRAWLMRHEGLTAQEATRRLGKVWPHMKHHNTDFEAALDTPHVLTRPPPRRSDGRSLAGVRPRSVRVFRRSCRPFSVLDTAKGRHERANRGSTPLANHGA